MIPIFHAISSLARSTRALGLYLGIIIGTGGAMVFGLNAQAEVVSGRIKPPKDELRAEAKLGYVRTRVTSRSLEAGLNPPQLAVFMTVKESLPLEPTPPAEIALSGLGLRPGIASCAVDGRIALKNADREPATFIVAGNTLGTVAPGEALMYECTAGTRGDELRSIRVAEWPNARGGIYVGEVGVPGAVTLDGAFRITAPRGVYILRILGLAGVLKTVEVEVGDRPVDIGVIELSLDTEN